MEVLTLAGGRRFDSSRSRGPPLKTKIGVGAVIRGILFSQLGVYELRLLDADCTGWDEGVPQMSLGEKAILTISA